MSKARDSFYGFYTLEFLKENQKDYPLIFDYIAELEQQKVELINLLQSLWNICYIPEKYMEKGRYIETKLTEYMEHLT